MGTLPVDGVDELGGFGEVHEVGNDLRQLFLFFSPNVGDGVESKGRLHCLQINYKAFIKKRIPLLALLI